MKGFKRYVHFVLAFILLVFGSIGIYWFNGAYNQIQLKNNQLKLFNAHNSAISIFSNSIEKYAAIVAGLQAYVQLSENLPDPEAMQEFVNFQLNGVKYDGPIAVSLLDTTHTFLFTFNRKYIDPGILKGTNLQLIREEEELRRLNDLMKSDSIRLFFPINLVEGWLGIPINARVQRNKKTIGYLAPIFDFQSIIQPVYDDLSSSEYIFHFSTQKGDFDREIFHDGSKVYNERRDSLYYNNFDVESSDFLYSSIDLYGRNIRIGTAYKYPNKQEALLERILYGWLITLWVLVFLITWQVHRYKKLNFELNKLNNTKNKFFSIIGHDLKGPLNSLTSFSSLLINHTSSLSKEEIKMLAKDLDKSLKNLFALLENLLQWSRSQTGNIEFTPETFDITSVLNENRTLLLKQAENKGVSMEVVSNMPVQVFAHVNSISTVVRNLLSNAIKFTNKGGKIFLNIIEEGSTVIVQVKDSGVGMSEVKRSKIFDLGSSSSTLGTDKEQGTGLGLILCKEFVEKNGGKVWLESEQGVGTTFYFTIPK